MNFTFPYALLLLLLIPAVGALRLVGNRPSVWLNVTYRAANLPVTWRLRLRACLPVLRTLGLLILIVSAAGPFDRQALSPGPNEGIAIEMVFDRSGSMLADDYRQNDTRVSRLEAAKEAAIRFTMGDPQAQQRLSDSIGLVAFAARAEVACPLTVDHEAVVAELERTTAAADFREDGTAIGDALGLAVAELQSLESSTRETIGLAALSPNIEPTSSLTKIIVLLTDGQQNAGELTPERASALAAHYGVKIYVIGLEPEKPRSEATDSRQSAEKRKMQAIAETTGGEYYTVNTSQALHEVYDDINSLERSTLPGRQWKLPRYWAVSWFQVGRFGIPPLAALGLMFLTAECCLRWSLLSEAH